MGDYAVQFPRDSGTLVEHGPPRPFPFGQLGLVSQGACWGRLQEAASSAPTANATLSSVAVSTPGPSRTTQNRDRGHPQDRRHPARYPRQQVGRPWGVIPRPDRGPTGG